MSLNRSRKAPQRMGLLAAILVGTLLFYPLALASHIPLTEPNEGLHAAIAQEMAERGDWVVPRLLGKPFLDKPILYSWTVALSLRCLGMTEAAVRLPGLLLGLLGVVTTAALAWRILGRTTGLIAGLFYATTILPAALTQIPAHDVALVPWVNLALLSFWEADLAPTRRAALGWAAAAGLMLGLAILTKGLAGVAIVGITYGGYLLAIRRLGPATCLRGALALATAALLGSAWYLAVSLATPTPVWAWATKRPQAALALGLLAGTAQFALILTMVVPPVASGFSARDLAIHFNESGQFPPRLLVFEEGIGSLVFYLNRELRAGLRHEQAACLKLSKASTLSKPADSQILVVPEPQVGKASRCFDLTGAAFAQAGRYRIYRAADVEPRLEISSLKSAVRHPQSPVVR